MGMKTIEELRKEAEDAEIGHDYSLYDEFYNRIYKIIYDGLVKSICSWIDPKKGVPMDGVEVLVTVDAEDHTYDVMKHDKHGWWQKAPGGGWCAPNNAPIGWRYVHEIER